MVIGNKQGTIRNFSAKVELLWYLGQLQYQIEYIFKFHKNIVLNSPFCFIYVRIERTLIVIYKIQIMF